MDRAGGVGGLLMLTAHASPNTNCFVSYDGNGNVTALLDSAGGGALARYEYSPFGELLRATGPLAIANPFRFSTKFWDDETGLLYYNYRYYSPLVGRWIGRDPAEEEGGNNLYLFVANSPVLQVDADGRFLFLDIFFTDTVIKKLRIEQAAVWSRIAGPILRRLYEGAIFVPAVATQLAFVGTGRAYAATRMILYANPTLAYEAASLFTQGIGMQPGPTPGTPGNLAGAAVNAVRNEIFQAWMDYVADPSTP
jgi:RHS repeat-associated protein